ncbi:MAG: hypothetical protein U0X93_16810 [Anaerolineales bacterium]
MDELAAEFPQVYQKVTGKGLLIGQHFNTPEAGLQGRGGVVQARRVGGWHAHWRADHPHQAR